MRVVFAPIDTHNRNHLAQPNTVPYQITMAYGVLLETDEERELLATAHMPMSPQHPQDEKGFLAPVENYLQRQLNRRRYYTLTIEQLRQGLVGLHYNYLFTDRDMLGFDFKRGDGDGGFTGGVTFTFPPVSPMPSFPYCGTITGTWDGGVVLNGEHNLPLPDDTRINSLSETTVDPLLVIAD